VAIIENERVDLRMGALVLIGRGEKHEIRGTALEALQSLNVYVPPVYTAEGNEVPADRR
jgi:hypothetical protein